MMESILVLTHTDETGSALAKSSLEAITAGKELAASLSASLTIGIVAANPTAASSTLASTQARLIAVFGEQAHLSCYRFRRGNRQCRQSRGQGNWLHGCDR